MDLHFAVDLQPEEYRRAMLWRQFASTPGRRINDLAGWAVLVLIPLTLILLLVFVPDGLSIWFWPVAILAFGYGVYSTLVMRRQIRREAESVLTANPVLARTHYRVHEKGIHASAVDASGGEVKLFLPWKKIEQVQELTNVYLLFVSDEEMLIVPKRCLPDEMAFRRLIDQVIPDWVKAR